MRCSRLLVAVITLVGVLAPVSVSAASGRSQTLAFERTTGSEKGVYLVRADGSGERRITSGLDPSDRGYGVSWAPNARRFVFSGMEEGGNTSRLYIVRRDGTNLHALTGGGREYGDQMAAWSPTGGQVVFMRVGFDRVHLFAVRVEGDGFVYVSGGADPQWFPGGGKVVFVGNDGSYRNQLFKETVPPDFNHRRWQISHSPRRSDADNFGPDVSPSGKRIVYVRMFEGLHLGRRHWALRVMRADGSGDHLVTKGRRVFPDPEWSPNGRRIVFVGRRHGNNDIYTIRGDGTGLRRLTHRPGPESDPTWSPTGRRIAFVSTRDDNKEIYVMRRDGSGERRITFSPEVDEAPVWAAPGSRLGSAP